jgi:hypothetical protein
MTLHLKYFKDILLIITIARLNKFNIDSISSNTAFRKTFPQYPQNNLYIFLKSRILLKYMHCSGMSRRTPVFLSTFIHWHSFVKKRVSFFPIRAIIHLDAQVDANLSSRDLYKFISASF